MSQNVIVGNSPCVLCACYPCICSPGCILPIPGISFAPNYLCVTCWSTPCVCPTRVDDSSGPTVYCALCYQHPCVCQVNQHWFCSCCGHNFCTCRLPCGCFKGAGCECSGTRKRELEADIDCPCGVGCIKCSLNYDDGKKCDCEDGYECYSCCPPEKDNWSHRSEGMRCETCMWWVRKVGSFDPPMKVPVGRCRKKAPTLSGWPVLYDNDWCGDHKLDETKLK